MTNYTSWALIIVPGIGLIINWTVLNRSIFVLYGMGLLGINGPTQRDARYVRAKNVILAIVQALILGSGFWLAHMPPPRPEVGRHLEPSYWVLLLISSLIATVGVLNLRLAHLQLEDYRARHRGEKRTRGTDS